MSRLRSSERRPASGPVSDTRSNTWSKIRSKTRSNRRGRTRGQTGLPALAIALLLLTTVTGLSLAIADGALSNAAMASGEQRLASSLAERIVARESPLTRRANVLNATRIEQFNGPELTTLFPVADGNDVRISVDGSTIAQTGDVTGGKTFRRVVLIENETDQLLPAVGDERRVTLPRRTGRATITIRPPPNASVTTVRANDRVVLLNSSGLAGTFDLRLSRFETTQFRFSGTGSLEKGNVTIRYRVPRTTKTMLVVTVDD